MCVLVGLGKASFITSHKFTERRQHSCGTRGVDDRCARGLELGCCGKNTKGGGRGDMEDRAE